MAGPQHPGEHLTERLRQFSLNCNRLAVALKVPCNRIWAISRGRKRVTAETSLRLAHYFGDSPEHWLDLQTQYDLFVAQQKFGAQVKALPRLRGRANA